jgi:hypothetical protein
MKLIDNARQWWRFTSVRATAFWSALLAAWPLLAPQYQETLLGGIVGPDRVQAVLAGLAFSHILAERLRAQPELHD